MDDLTRAVPDPEQMVTVARFEDPVEAQMAKGHARGGRDGVLSAGRERESICLGCAFRARLLVHRRDEARHGSFCLTPEEMGGREEGPLRRMSVHDPMQIHAPAAGRCFACRGEWTRPCARRWRRGTTTCTRCTSAMASGRRRASWPSADGDCADHRGEGVAAAEDGSVSQDRGIGPDGRLDRGAGRSGGGGGHRSGDSGDLCSVPQCALSFGGGELGGGGGREEDFYRGGGAGQLGLPGLPAGVL